MTSQAQDNCQCPECCARRAYEHLRQSVLSDPVLAVMIVSVLVHRLGGQARITTEEVHQWFNLHNGQGLLQELDQDNMTIEFKIVPTGSQRGSHVH